MINSGNGEQIMDEIINSVATVYNWKEYYEPVYKKVIDVPDEILRKYEGLYMAVKDKFVYISKKEDGYYQKADGSSSKMLFTSEKDFFSMAVQSEKHFTTDAVGNVTGFIRTTNDSKMTVVKILSPDPLNASPYFFYTAGKSFFEDKSFDDAIKYFKRGLDLYPNTLILTAYIAHANLFNNNYDGALKIYKEHLNETAKDGRKWTDIISQDFVWLKNNKFDTKLMDKIFADLKLKIPKEYETK
jgi:tetratricopeptide (TPR) repeat protein